MRPFCIHSLSHAVWCLATAEGIPYVSAFSHMPSGVLATDKGIPYEPIRPPLAPLIDFERGVPAPPRQCRAGSLRAAGQCSQKTETEINRQQRHSISVTTTPLNSSCISQRPTSHNRKTPLHLLYFLHVIQCLASNEKIPYISTQNQFSLKCRPLFRLSQQHTLCNRACTLSGVSRQLKAYPMRPFCIHSLSHAVRCLASAEGIQLKINSLHPWACMCSTEQCNGFATRLRLMLAPCL